MKKIFLIFLLITFAISCKENSVNTALLIGEWEFITPKPIINELENTTETYYHSGFEIENDSIFVTTDGFFETVTHEPEKTKFYGQKTKYYVKSDSLYILNPINSKYYSQKIAKLTKDTLILTYKGDDNIYSFKKKKTTTSTKISIDQITLSLDPCFGACPISSISINSEGNIFYYGKGNVKNEGFFTGKIRKEIFNEIVADLNNIRFTELENKYTAGPVTDLPGFSVTFVKDNKILKSIYDYGYSSPRNLRGILNKVQYAYQDANLKEIVYSYPIINGNFPPKLMILDSEAFYLQTLLLKAKESHSKFVTKYKQKTSLVIPPNFDYEKYEQMQRRIETDGRYFKIENKNYEATTFDIGFNFFERNATILRAH